MGKHIDKQVKNTVIELYQSGHLVQANLQLRHGKHGRGSSWICNKCGSIDLIPVPIEDGSGQ